MINEDVKIFKVIRYNKEEKGNLEYQIQIYKDFIKVVKIKKGDKVDEIHEEVFSPSNIEINSDGELFNNPKVFTFYRFDKKKNKRRKFTYEASNKKEMSEIIEELKRKKKEYQKKFLSDTYQKLLAINEEDKNDNLREFIQNHLFFQFSQLITDLELTYYDFKELMLDKNANHLEINNAMLRIEAISIEMNAQYSKISSAILKALNNEKKLEEKVLFNSINKQNNNEYKISNSQITLLGNKPTPIDCIQPIVIKKKKEPISQNNKNNKILIDYKDPLYDSLIHFEQYSYQLTLYRDLFSQTFKCVSNGNRDSIPIKFLEPLTMLQKQCEKFHFIKFLKMAAKYIYKKNIPLAYCYILTFIVSELSINYNRFLPPITPQFGETFEYINNNLKYIYFAEQVSLNPPISAYCCETAEFNYYSEAKGEWKYNVQEKAMEYEEKTERRIKLSETGQVLSYKMPIIQIKNYFFGNPYFSIRGKSSISMDVNGDFIGEIEFNKGESEGDFIGVVKDYKDEIYYQIKGNWITKFISEEYGNEYTSPYTLWEVDQNERYLKNKIGHLNDFKYFLPSFSYDLNSCSQELLKTIEPNDVRNREDIHFYIAGRVEEAQKKYKEIKEKQTKEKDPKYFSINVDAFGRIYIFNNEYWKNRESGKYGR